MSLLFPLYLLGAAAIAVPIILHLTRKTPKDKVPFSSLMFLEETPLRLNKRNRLEHVLLLLLRCLALLLLAFLFARPFVDDPDALENTEAEQVVYVLDASASMRRGDLWAQAVKELNESWNTLGEEDRAALVVFDDRVDLRIDFENWDAEKTRPRELLAGRLDEVKPGWGASGIGRALVRASELISEDEADSGGRAFAIRKVVLISDMQEGGALEDIQGYEWPSGLGFELRRMTADLSSNASLHPVISIEDVKLGGEAPRPMVRVHNHKPSDREQFTVSWGGDTRTAAVSVTVPAGQSRVVQVPPRPPGADGRFLTLRGDDTEFDNVLYVAPVLERQVNILFIGETASGDPEQPLFYLKRALQRTRQLNPVITAKAPGASLQGLDFDAIDFLVIGAQPGAAQLPGLKTWLQAGGAGLYLCREGDTGDGLSTLLDTPGLALREGKVDEYAMLAKLDFESPLLKAFDDPEFSDFSNIHVWKYRRLPDGALPDPRVYARYDNGDPAWLSCPAGKGLLFVFASGWHPADSQLALSTKFIPLLYAVLETGRRAVSTEPELHYVGGVIPLPDRISKVLLPDGGEVELAESATSFAQTRQPGTYQLVAPDRVIPVAVNLRPEESRTGPLSNEALEPFALAAAAPETVEKPGESDEDKRQLKEEDQERGQKLWRWLILGVWGILLLESSLAAVRPQPAGETA